MDKSLTIDGEKRLTHMLSSRHPALDVADYDERAEFEEEFLVATATADEEGPGGVMTRRPEATQTSRGGLHDDQRKTTGGGHLFGDRS